MRDIPERVSEKMSHLYLKNFLEIYNFHYHTAKYIGEWAGG